MLPYSKRVTGEERLQKFRYDLRKTLIKYPSQTTNRFRAPPTDRLSTLPPELLTIIFDLIRTENEDEQMAGGISRALCPYTEVNLYRAVSFSSLGTLKLFARTIVPDEKERTSSMKRNRAEHLALLVKSFQVILNAYGRAYDPEWGQFDALSLFAALEEVTGIKLTYCPRLISTLTSYACANSHLPHLKTLEMFALVAGEAPIYTMDRFKRLRRYSELETLIISYEDVEYSGFEKEWGAIPRLEPVKSAFCLTVRVLELENDFGGTTSEGLATFLSYFGCLDRLSLTDRSGDIDYDIALSQVRSELLHLEVHGTDMDDEDTIPFGKALVRFPLLQTLAMDEYTFDDATILAVQKCVSLKTLHLDCGNWSTFPRSALKELFHRKSRPSTLTELKVDIPTGTEGQSLDHLVEAPTTTFEVGWYLPMERNSSEPADARAFISAAAKIGVTVTGKLLEALRVQTKWEEAILKIERRQSAKFEVDKAAKKLVQDSGW